MSTGQMQESERADVGLLMVHGIGRQPKGLALRDLASSILAWCEAWPKDGKGALAAEVGPTMFTGQEPAHTYLDVRSRERPGNLSSRWLVAEAWWAKSFSPPTVGQTSRWLLLKAPLLGTTRGFEYLENAYRRAWNHLAEVWRLPFALVVTLASSPLVLLLGFLLLFSSLLRLLIPLQSVRKALGFLQTFFTEVLGDSYFFEADALSKRAMTTAVARDLDWLQQRSRRVVVVAHSQGAAVTHDVLSERADPAIRLITLGSGLAQLEWLHKVGRLNFIIGTITWLAILGLSSFLGWASYCAVTGCAERLVIGIGMLAGWYGIPIAIGAMIGSLYQHVRKAQLNRREESTAPPYQWLDMYSTADPVPGGDIAARMFAGVRGREVVNRRNVLRDHSLYLRNMDECVPEIVCAALEESETPPNTLIGGIRARSELTSRLRRRRSDWLVRLRLMTAATTSLIVVGVYAPLTDFSRSLVGSVAGNLGPLRDIQLPEGVSRFTSPLLHGATSALFVAGIVYAVGLLILKTWAWEDLEDLEALAGGKSGTAEVEAPVSRSLLATYFVVGLVVGLGTVAWSSIAWVGDWIGFVVITLAVQGGFFRLTYRRIARGLSRLTRRPSDETTKNLKRALFHFVPAGALLASLPLTSPVTSSYSGVMPWVELVVRLGVAVLLSILTAALLGPAIGRSTAWGATNQAHTHAADAAPPVGLPIFAGLAAALAVNTISFIWVNPTNLTVGMIVWFLMPLVTLGGLAKLWESKHSDPPAFFWIGTACVAGVIVLAFGSCVRALG